MFEDSLRRLLSIFPVVVIGELVVVVDVDVFDDFDFDDLEDRETSAESVKLKKFRHRNNLNPCILVTKCIFSKKKFYFELVSK